MKTWLIVKCRECGSCFDLTEMRPDGLPAGVGLELKGGKRIYVCTDCINRIGTRRQEVKDGNDNE